MAKINPGLTSEVCAAIRAHFKKTGQVSVLDVLTNWLVPQPVWKKTYDPLRFSFSKAKAPSWAREFKALLQSITGKGKMTIELRKFDKGDYTLLYDDLKDGKGVFFSLEFTSLKEDWGGFTSFVADGEVARIVPKANTLFLVQQDGLKSFVKYVNHHTAHPRIALQGVVYASK